MPNHSAIRTAQQAHPPLTARSERASSRENVVPILQPNWQASAKGESFERVSQPLRDATRLRPQIHSRRFAADQGDIEVGRFQFATKPVRHRGLLQRAPLPEELPPFRSWGTGDQAPDLLQLSDGKRRQTWDSGRLLPEHHRHPERGDKWWDRERESSSLVPQVAELARATDRGGLETESKVLRPATRIRQVTSQNSDLRMRLRWRSGVEFRFYWETTTLVGDLP